MPYVEILKMTTTTIQIPERMYFRIGDVAELLGIKPYVLRYWETEFPMITPEKSPSGQRVYRRNDVETILMIKHLLYEERYSIEGARKRIQELRKQGDLKSFKKEAAGEAVTIGTSQEKLEEIKSLARELKEMTSKPMSELFRA